MTDWTRDGAPALRTGDAFRPLRADSVTGSRRAAMPVAVAVVAAGCAALLARPWLVRLPVDPVDAAGRPVRGPRPGGGDVAAAGGRPATAGRRRRRRRRRPCPPWLAWASGWGPSGSGRLLAVGSVPVAPFILTSVALNSLAAVAEEAFFRRFAYGLAAVRGPAVAVVASAAIFAAVHVTVWGWAVLPLDLAAGLVLGWQRWASGGWAVPAATHVAANILAVW